MSRTRTQIYLEDAQIAALDARAKATGVTRSEVIRDLVDKGLADPANKPSLYEVLMRLGPPKPNPSMTPEAFAKRRAEFEAEFEVRQKRWKAQRRGKRT